MLVDRSVRDFLTALASPAPTPGGGAAAALAGALGSALLVMVALHHKSRTGEESERAILAAAAGPLEAIRTQLIEAVDADAASYEAVMAAYRQPKGTNAEQKTRRQAVQDAFRQATEVPLRVMTLSAAALGHAAAIADAAYRPVATDGRAAVALLRAGFHAARLNVAANVDSVADDAYVVSVRAELVRLGDTAATAADRADALLARS